MIKFGRVPFRVKENSVQLNSSNWVDSWGHDEDEKTIEKNLTDVDSVDLERELNLAKIASDDES